ncbi:MAG: ferredoxin Fer [Haloarculaceae archaeon]
MDSPFEVLLVDPDADDEEIERAYRERVKEAHPDQGGTVEEFQAVRTAYERIKAGYPGEPGAMGGQERPQGSDDGSDATEYGAATTRVTYLNYDVLTDHGWEIDDGDLFERAEGADLDERDYGQFRVDPGETLLEAAEARGFAWPFACRGGACANCAIMLLSGELSMPVSHVLPEELMERGIRLSCNGIPITDELEVVYNVKHMPELEELLLPPRPFEQAHLDD